jgi:hypothetical protein
VALPLLLKNYSHTSPEAHVTKGSDGKPYLHSCCSWNVTYVLKSCLDNRVFFGSIFSYSGCPDDWLSGLDPKYGECYKFADESSQGSYSDAKSYCTSKNGYLTDILNQQTQDFLVSNIPSELKLEEKIMG